MLAKAVRREQRLRATLNLNYLPLGDQPNEFQVHHIPSRSLDQSGNLQCIYIWFLYIVCTSRRCSICIPERKNIANFSNFNGTFLALQGVPR